MPARSSGWSAKQPIVVGMAANPEPDEPVRCFDREGAIVSADAGDQKRPIFLKGSEGCRGSCLRRAYA